MTRLRYAALVFMSVSIGACGFGPKPDEPDRIGDDTGPLAAPTDATGGSSDTTAVEQPSDGGGDGTTGLHDDDACGTGDASADGDAADADPDAVSGCLLDAGDATDASDAGDGG